MLSPGHARHQIVEPEERLTERLVTSAALLRAEKGVNPSKSVNKCPSPRLGGSSRGIVACRMSSPKAVEKGATSRARLLSAVGVGAVIGFIQVAFLLSFAALVFAGTAPGDLARGAGFMLLGAAVLNLIGARWSSLPGAVVIPQDTTTAITAATVGTLLATVDPEFRFGSTVLYVAACTALTGVSMVLIGLFRRGGLIRFIPLPVIGGFLSGTGYLLVVGGVDLVTGGLELTPTSWVALLAAAVFAVALLVAVRRRPGVLLVPAAVLGGLTVFFLTLLVSGTSFDDARGLGLLASSADTVLGLPLDLLRTADWSVLGRGAGGLITVALVATLGMLLNVSALEVIGESDADLDRELRGVGVANIAAAVTGTTAGYHSLGLTALGYRVGVVSRLVPLTVAVVCLSAGLIGGTLISVVPIPLIGAMLIFLGLGFITDWLVDARRRMTGPEVFLMVAIVVAVATIGFLAAVALGMVAAVIIFVVAYSRVDPVRHVATGSELRSSIDRPPLAEEILETKAEAILIVELQGFLFFGTSKTVVDRVSMMMDGEDVRCLVIDLRHVDGADSTAVAALAKLARLARSRSCPLVVCDIPGSLRSDLVEALGGFPEVSLTADLDHALEFAEEVVIGDIVDARACSLGEIFGIAEWERIRPYLAVLRARPGEEVISFGESSMGILLVERGRIVTEIPSNGGWRRVRSSGPGAIVGEMSLYRSGIRSARVMAVEPSILLSLDGEAIARIEQDNPALAVHLHKTLAGVLAERVAAGNAAVAALLR